MRHLKLLSFGAAALLTACSATSRAVSEPSTTTVAAITTATPATAAPPVDPLTVPVPVLCEQPAGTLADGSLPDPVSNGYVSVIPEHVTSGDLVGDATPETVVPIACSAGGIGWPNTIHIYAPGPVHLAQIDLGDYNPGGLVALLESVEVADGVLVARWLTDAPGDPTCCPTVRLEGRFTLSVRADGEITVLEGSLPAVSTVPTTVMASASTVPTTAAASATTAATGAPPAGTTSEVDAAAARLQQWFAAWGTGDAETYCAIAAPVIEAEGIPVDECPEWFGFMRDQSPQEDLQSFARVTIDASQAVLAAPDRVEVPGSAVNFPTPISDPPAPDDLFVMGHDGTDWLLIEGTG